MNQTNPTIQFAYEECERYLKRMAPDQVYEINIETQTNDNHFDDGFKLKFNNNKLHIIAAQPRSGLIAVYFFLNQLGARFLSPTQEMIPQVKLENYNFNFEEKAALRHRGVCIEGANSIENILDFIDYLPKIYMNSFFVQFNSPQPFLRRYYQHMNNEYLTEKQDVDYEKMVEAVDAAIAKRSLIHHRVGHGWTSKVLGFDFDLAWDQGYEIDASQKELVASLQGKRALHMGSPTMTSLCLDQKEVKRRFVNEVLRYAQNRPDVDVLHIWLSDAFNNVCECSACIKTTVADQYIEILNLIDEAMSQATCDHKLCFLLYQELLWPAEHATLTNPDRFIMMFAPITRPFEKSYVDHDIIEKPVAYQRNQIKLPDSLEENMSFLKAWQENYQGDQFVYDYPLGRAHYGDLGYLKISDTIARDIPYLKQMNLNGYISCQELRASLPHGYPNYLMGHLLWNHDLDETQLRHDYFKNMYGLHYHVVLNYYEALSYYSSPDYFNGKTDRVNPELQEQFKKLYEVSQTQISKSLPLNYRDQIDYHQKIAQSLAAILYDKVSGKETKTAWQVLKKMIQENELAYQPLFDVYRFIEIAQNYTQLNQD